MVDDSVDTELSRDARPRHHMCAGKLGNRTLTRPDGVRRRCSRPSGRSPRRCRDQAMGSRHRVRRCLGAGIRSAATPRSSPRARGKRVAESDTVGGAEARGWCRARRIGGRPRGHADQPSSLTAALEVAATARAAGRPRSSGIRSRGNQPEESDPGFATVVSAAISAGFAFEVGLRCG